MIAVINDTDADQLVVTELPDPRPKPHELLVRVRAAGLNRADINARRGGRRITPRPEEADQPPVAGLELAGEVIAVGDDVVGWQVGDRVMARGRGYAEQAVVDAAAALRVPDDMPWEVAGGMPIAVMTMHDALRTAGRMQPGDAVLIQAATSGVGVVGCRIAAQLGASTVFATSRSGAKLERLRSELADVPQLVGIDTSTEDVAAVVQQRTNGAGVAVIVDNIGGSALAANLASAAICGRIVQVGRLGGKVTEIDLDELARKRVALIGVTFRTRSTADVRDVVRRVEADLGTHLDSVAPVVDACYPLHDARAAQDALATNAHVGKLVLVPDHATIQEGR